MAKARYADACAARYADGTQVLDGDLCMTGFDVRKVDAVVWGEEVSTVVLCDDGLDPKSVDVETNGRSGLELCVRGSDGRPIHKGTVVVCDGESGDGNPWFVRRITRCRYPIDCGSRQLRAEWCRAASVDELSGMLTRAYAEEGAATDGFLDALSSIIARGRKTGGER